MIELEYPQNKESEQFSPSFKGVAEIKPTNSSADSEIEKFFEINPDSYDEQTRQEIENIDENAGTSALGLDKVAESIFPFQDNTYDLGSSPKAWQDIYAYTYRKNNGDELPFITTFSGDGVSSVDVLAQSSEDTLNFTSSNSTVSIVGNNTTSTIDLTVNSATVQAKTSYTIGTDSFNDYVVDVSNPLAAFTSLFNKISSSPDHTTIYVQDGTYNFTSTLVIPKTADFTMECGHNGAQLFATSGKAIQIGDNTAPSTNVYQTFKGIYFESIEIKSPTVVTFDGCVLNEVKIGDNSATQSFYPVNINNSHVYGEIEVENGYDVALNNCYHDAINGTPATIDQSQNIRWNNCSIRAIGSPITLTDDTNDTTRIMFSDCVYENYNSAINLFTDSRTNTTSTKLYATGIGLNITMTAASYNQPSTNYINVI